PLLVIEPAIALLEQHQYRAIDPDYPSELVTPLARFLEARLHRLPTPSSAGAVQLLGHCAEKSLAPEHSQAYRRLLEAVGYQVTVPLVTCCGMAGIFGHERENLAMSRDVFDLSWRTRLEGAENVVACAPGYSCRSQVKRFASRKIAHPIELVAERLDS
ncbi:MAG: (Fe-S)-binding protein, partial [Acidimicrobiia bacterium]|nr:(Fe-S)-binding protein [Acidimicrobiia bacterium]